MIRYEKGSTTILRHSSLLLAPLPLPPANCHSSFPPFTNFHRSLFWLLFAGRQFLSLSKACASHVAEMTTYPSVFLIPAYFPGGAIAMPKMLADEGVEYDDGTPATESQQAKVWAAAS